MRRFNPEKELYKIQHGKRDKIFIGAFLILLIISISSTYALYQVRYSKRIIYTKVASFNTSDLELAIYLDGEELDKLPEKDEEYYYDSITCENDPNATAEWDYANQKLNTYTTIPNKCDIHFISHSPALNERIKYLNGTTLDLVVDDETIEHNLRYIGKDPNNYIWFNCNDYSKEMNESNCEKWQIIGLMNNVPKPDGSNESLVKIIRADKIGNIAWDSSNYNNWATASLQKGLNGPYLDETNDSWITSGNYGTTNTQSEKYKSITSATKKIIEKVTWNLGAGSANTVQELYTAERGTVQHESYPTTWPEYIGLISLSDYGYATSGSGLPDDSTTNREACLNTILDNWNSGNYKTNCAENDWLLDTLTFRTDSYWTYVVVFVGVGGGTGATNARDPAAVKPTLYLKSNVKIESGDGSSATPYILAP